MVSEIDNKFFILKNAPEDAVNIDLSSPDATFELKESKFSANNLQPTAVAVRVLLLSNDPTQRGWIQKGADSKSMYIKPSVNGDVVRALALGEIIAVGSDVKDYVVGDIINGLLHWTQYDIIDVSAIFNKVDTSKNLPLEYYLSIFGMTSLTAWIGLVTIGQVKSSDVVVVSAASGATGNMVVQLAKKVYKCKKVIGISSTEEKCRFVESVGADICLNYRDSQFKEKLAKECGDDGANIYFDCVGGSILEAVMKNTANHGTIVACGAISGYNDSSKFVIYSWPLIITKRLTVKGFIVGDNKDKFAEAIQVLSSAFVKGDITLKKDENYSVFDATGDKFEKIPEYWHALFEDSKPMGKLLTLVYKK